MKSFGDGRMRKRRRKDSFVAENSNRKISLKLNDSASDWDACPTPESDRENVRDTSEVDGPNVHAPPQCTDELEEELEEEEEELEEEEEDIEFNLHPIAFENHQNEQPVMNCTSRTQKSQENSEIDVEGSEEDILHFLQDAVNRNDPSGTFCE